MRSLSLAFACLALSACLPAQQSQFNPSQINFVAHFASPPIAPLVNSVYMFVDASASGVCTGGGTATAWCRWTGTSYAAVGAAFTGLGDPGANCVPFRNTPGGTVCAIASNFPTLNQSTTGNAATATAFASTPTLCTTGFAPIGVSASGNAAGCAAIQAPFTSQSQNLFFASPNGSSGVPGFRAIAATDIPTLNQSTTGTAVNVTGVVARVNGGLNSSSPGTGFLRDGSTPTAGELSGDCATSGSFAITCTSVAHVNNGILAIAQGGSGLNTTSAHFAFIGPSSGSGSPSFRLLAAGDIPALGYVQLSGDLGNSAATPWVVSTHLASGLPRAQGGLNSTSAGTGILRDGTTPAASELSGDLATSGSNVTVLATVNSGPGTCADATHVCQITTNGKGLVTAQTAVSITAGGGTTNSAPQYDTPYYSAAGTSNTLSGVAINGLVEASTSGAPAAATGHNVSSLLTCYDTSGSSTSQVCNTTPSFTPLLGDVIVYRTTTPSGGALRINVNSSFGALVYKLGGSVVASYGDIPADVPMLLTFDGANWQAGGSIQSLASSVFYAITCPDSSGSGTAQVCVTAPQFNVIAGAVIVFYTSTANTGSSFTINVNSGSANPLGAIPVRKNGGSAALSPADIRAGTTYLLTYDGAYWEMPASGNATITTANNCSSSTSAANCGSAATGAVAIPTGVTSVSLVVNDTAVTANSRIFLTSDDSLTIPGATCNSTLATLVGGMAVTARTPGTSFTITYSGTIATNPLCISFILAN